MTLMISFSALSALTKLDALLDARSLRRSQIAILKVKCIKCINFLVNTSISVSPIYIPIGGMANRWFYALDALFSLCISNLMHFLMHFDALFWHPAIDSHALILIQEAGA